MKTAKLIFCFLLVALLSCAALAQDTSKRKLIEIYRIAPGKHVEFLKIIAQFDEANRVAGVPPRDLYVHSDGASWDFMLIQPAELTDEQSKAVSEASEKLNLPRGAKFFVQFRANVAEHSDTFAEGPITAKEYLSRLEEK